MPVVAPAGARIDCSVYLIRRQPAYPLARVHDIVRYLDELLEPQRFEDYGPNGLQVPGPEEIEVVATGVSASLELFERAAHLGAGLVVVHHGLLWDKAPRSITPTLAGRLRALLCRDIGLAAYHLPLDAHPQVGNNALIARGLGCQDPRPFAEHHGRAVGVAAHLPAGGMALSELVKRVRALTGRDPLVFDGGPEPVRTIGIVSGGGAGSLAQAAEEGLDALLTGEPAEPAMTEAREAAVHFIAAGHYATETFGVRRLGEILEGRFGVRHRFIDVPNPV